MRRCITLLYARIFIKALTRLLLTTEYISIIILVNRRGFELFSRRYSGNVGTCIHMMERD